MIKMYRVLQQPNGKWCVWDTVIDRFIYINVTDIYADQMNERAKSLYYERNLENPQTLKDNANVGAEIDFNFLAEDMGDEEFKELFCKLNDKDGLYEDFTSRYYKTEEEYELKHLMRIYSNGYKQTIKELGEKHDEIMENIRKGGIESVEITIAIDTFGEIPRYNIKYNHIPDLSKPL